MGAALINFELKKMKKSMSNKAFAKDKSVLSSFLIQATVCLNKLEAQVM
jgi:hypothetical protein